MNHANLIDKCITDLPPCCIQVHSSKRVFFIGTYFLDSNDSSASRTRTGSVDVYDHQLHLIQRVETESAVLDLKICPCDPDLIVTAHSTGCIMFWKWNNSELKLVRKSEIVEETDLITSLVFSEFISSLISITTTKGKVILLRFSGDRLDIERTWECHDLESWISSFVHDENTLLSGGDDQYLISYDIRQEMPIWRTRNIHDAGITSILPLKDGQRLWTGGYDDQLKETDLRNINIIQPRVLKNMDLGGGVWRLLPNTTCDYRILACCMYNGAKILSPDGLESESPATIINTIKQGHESMVYGGGWYDDDKVITCSFYDKVVQTWRV